jgi:hypothetical protein
MNYNHPYYEVILDGNQYNLLLTEVFGFTSLTNTIGLDDLPLEFVERLLLALELQDKFGFTIVLK